MNPEIFESSWFSLILSWIFAIPTFISIVYLLFGAFIKYEELPRALTIWIGICILWLSPVRYCIFLILASSSFPLQSFSAFIDALILAFYIPLVYALLGGFSIIPFLAIIKLFNEPKTWKNLIIALVFPILCVLSSLIFYNLLPYAGKSIRWVSTKNIIRATNGPAAFYFKYAVAPFDIIQLPAFYDQTPMRDIDKLRCHVAMVCLSDKRKSYFLKNQYPEIWESIVENK
jgi:hypothetical protein